MSSNRTHANKPRTKELEAKVNQSKNVQSSAGKVALIVLGMHRSGTSALTGVMNSLGVELGRELYAPQQGVNERGFWEHSDIVDVHDELLAVLGSSWDDLLPLPDAWWSNPKLARIKSRLVQLVRRDFSSAALWGLKDPRMSLLLPLWLQVFDDLHVRPHFLIMFRDPVSVAKSLETRNGFPIEKSLHLWLAHNICAEQQSRGFPRVFIEFEELLRDPQKTLAEVERALDLSFPVPVPTAAKQLTEFLTPTLRHHTTESTCPSNELERLAFVEFDLLRRSSQGAPVDAIDFERVRTALSKLSSVVPEYWQQHLRSVASARGNFETMFYLIYRSMSWKLVRPLWWAERRIMRHHTTT